MRLGSLPIQMLKVEGSVLFVSCFIVIEIRDGCPRDCSGTSNGIPSRVIRRRCDCDGFYQHEDKDKIPLTEAQRAPAAISNNERTIL